MDLQEAITQKDNLYQRIKEVRALLDRCTDGSERLRQTDRLRILRDMYRDACAQVDVLRPPQERRHKAVRRTTIQTGNVGFDFFERCGATWADIQGTTWSELSHQTQEATARQADLLTKALRQAISSLTPMQLETVMARYQDGLSLAEIARRRGINRSTVCRVAKQALRKLERGVLAALQARECVGEDGFDFLRFTESTEILTERQREYLYYLLSDGTTMGEISAHLGVYRSTIKRGNDQIVGRLSTVSPSLPASRAIHRPRRKDWLRRSEREVAEELAIAPAVYYRLVCRDQPVGDMPRIAYEVLRLGDLSAAEAARQLGMSESTVRAYRRNYRGVDVFALPEPAPYKPAQRRRAQTDLRGLLRRGREAGGNTIGDSIDSKTYQRMMEVASRADP